MKLSAGDDPLAGSRKAEDGSRVFGLARMAAPRRVNGVAVEKQVEAKRRGVGERGFNQRKNMGARKNQTHTTAPP
ncbi:MAG: hypothetical protein ACT4O5_02660, partial [Gammaproteobacteria bacterium]